GGTMTRLVDELLRSAWNERGAWAPEIRLLDSLGQAFGWFSPRSLAELEDLEAGLPDVLKQLKGYSKAWRDAFDDLRSANLDRFLAAHPEWANRIDAASLAATDVGSVREALLRELAPFTRADRGTAERLAILRDKT